MFRFTNAKREPVVGICLASLIALSAAGCSGAQQGALKAYMAMEKGVEVEDGIQTIDNAAQSFTVTALTDELDFPWDVDFLPDRSLLVTERSGQLQRLDPQTGELRAIAGVPEVYYRGQGGLLGVLVHPEFEDNNWIYLSAAVELDDGMRTTRVIRYTLRDNRLGEARQIFEAIPAGDSGNHFGGAMLFDNDGYLYIAMGDRHQRYLAQDLDASLGKILRYHDDGRIPEDNPFVNKPGALPEIFSYGHRNPQGLAIDRASGRIWNAEHGPQGGDEINLLTAGANYGWPEITYGEEYGGGKIGEGTQREDVEPPLHYYIPSIGSAGLAYYSGDALPGWQGDLFLAGLRSFSMSRVTFEGLGTPQDERLLEDMSLRVRNIAQGPDDLLYVVTENGGVLLLAPAPTPPPA